MAREKRFVVRMSDAEVAALDAARGGATRSDWLRSVLVTFGGEDGVEQAPARTEPTPGKHLHVIERRGEDRYDNGRRIKIGYCACGKELER